MLLSSTLSEARESSVFGVVLSSASASSLVSLEDVLSSAAADVSSTSGASVSLCPSVSSGITSELNSSYTSGLSKFDPTTSLSVSFPAPVARESFDSALASSSGLRSIVAGESKYSAPSETLFAAMLATRSPRRSAIVKDFMYFKFEFFSQKKLGKEKNKESDIAMLTTTRTSLPLVVCPSLLLFPC